MMPSAIELGQLSGRVYSRTQANRTPLPFGWTDVQLIPDQASGFSAGVFRKGNEIVIAYTGTNERQVIDFLSANIPVALGQPSAQVIEAMKLYLNVKRDNPSASLTFTGHSLGGGLAALMAVYFDRPATTFDAAPFEASARDAQVLLNGYRASLLMAGFSDSAFNDLANSITNDLFLSREQRVDSIEVAGEVLSAGRLPGTNIMGSRSFIPVGQQNVSSIDLHSITLLNTLMQSTSFAVAISALPDSLKLFFDSSLLAADPKSSQEKNFLDHLLIQNSGVNNNSQFLDKFAADLNKLVDGTGAAKTIPTVRDALIAVAMEYYFLKDAPSANQIFFESNNALSFKYSDIGAPQYHSLRLLSAAISSTLVASEKEYVSSLQRRNSWHIQSGEGSMTFAAVGTESNAIIGGSEGDTLTGGSGIDNIIGGLGNDIIDGGADADILIGGGDNDTLTGGTGRDALIGGAGNDTYKIAAGDGVDTIIDSDGLGTIQYRRNGATADITLSGGKKLTDSQYNTVWQSDDAEITYAKTSGGLAISFKSDQSTKLFIRDFSSGQLGITLEDAYLPPPPKMQILGTASNDNSNLGGTGKDFQPTLLATGSNQELLGLGGADRLQAAFDGDIARGGDGNDYLVDIGSEVGTTAKQELFGDQGNDILLAANGDDKLFGGDGHDTLSGGDGDDILDGGDGNDFLDGGKGADTLIGGDGSDFIIGGGTFRGDYDAIKAVDNTLEVIQVDVAGNITRLARVKGANGEATNADVSMSGDGGNVIDAGAGNDIVYGGSGDDIIYAGADSDLVIGMAGADVIQGGSGNDRLYGDGTAGMFTDDTPNGIGASTQAELHADDDIEGGDGDDFIAGDGGSDTIEGGRGNDVIYGDSDKLAEAFHGDDFIDGGEGTDHVYGGAGDDTIFGGNSASDNLVGDVDYLSGDKGNDTIDGEDGNDVMSGGEGNDTLYGSTGDDHIEGDGGGADFSNNGDDFIDGGDGQDAIIGGGGKDTIFGGNGDDIILGDTNSDGTTGESDGDDTIQGDGGNDTIWGQGGNDSIDGGDGNDTLYGGDGTDVLSGEEGTDILLGGDENDSLFGGAGDRNELYGGAGNDTLVSEGTNDILSGGAGDDRLFASASGSELYGGTQNDSLHGNAGADLLSGGEGNDELLGGDGDDLLVGEDGNDNLDGGDGVDQLFGGAGDDTLDGGAGQSNYLDGGEGTNTLISRGVGDTIIANKGDNIIYVEGEGQTNVVIDDAVVDGGTATIRISRVATRNEISIEQVADGGNVFVLNTGDGRQVNLRGGVNHAISIAIELDSGDRVSLYDLLDSAGPINYAGVAESGGFVVGSGGADNLTLGNLGGIVQAGRGDDVIHGGSGSDSLDGGFGADVMSGHDGDDEYSVDNAGDRVIEEIGGGVDTVFSTIDFTLGANAENLYLDSADDRVGTGNELDNVIGGGDGRNTLIGLAGNDTLYGGLQDDVLEGGAGDDQLFGSDGNDTYVFGSEAGTDTLNDWIGDNTLRFNEATGPQGIQIRYLNANGDIRIDYATGASVTVLGNDAGGFSQVEFADGSTLSKTDFLAATLQNNLLVGTEDNDSLVGSATSDLVVGRSGDDTLAGNAGNDTLYGDEGDDLITGEGGNDGLFGGTGNDTLVGGDGDDIQVGGDGDDVIAGNDGNDTLMGDAGDDVIGGGAGNDTLFGGEGDDLLDGGAGDNVIDAGAGNDLMIGGEGNDTYIAGNLNEFGLKRIIDAGGQNTLKFGEGVKISDLATFRGDGDSGDVVVTIGNPGNSITISDALSGSITNFAFADGTSVGYSDFLSQTWKGGDLIGTSADDDLRGGTGNETINGLEGNDVLSGGAGNDSLEGGDGLDTLDGGAGDDVLRGGEDDDVLRGGSGTDELHGDGGRDQLDGGAGNDSLSGGDDVDTYLLNAGGGQDVVVGESGLNHILVGGNTGLDGVRAQTEGADVLVWRAVTGDSLRLTHYRDGGQRWQIDTAGGKTMSLDDLLVATATGGTSQSNTAEKIANYREIFAEKQLLSSSDGLSGLNLAEGTSNVTYTDRNGNRTDYQLGITRRTIQGDGTELVADGTEVYTSAISSQTTETRTSYTTSTETTTSTEQTYKLIPFDVSRLADTGIAGLQATYSNGNLVVNGKPKVTTTTTTVRTPVVEVINHVNRTVTDTVTSDTVQGGASDNTVINSGAGKLVDAGAGNDHVIDQGASGEMDHAGYGDQDTERYGDFLYGNAGDDVLNGRDQRDELIGGAGSDTMDGGRGADTYRIFADEDGHDLVLDSGANPLRVSIHFVGVVDGEGPGRVWDQALDIVGDLPRTSEALSALISLGLKENPYKPGTYVLEQPDFGSSDYYDTVQALPAKIVSALAPYFPGLQDRFDQLVADGQGQVRYDANGNIEAGFHLDTDFTSTAAEGLTGGNVEDVVSFEAGIERDALVVNRTFISVNGADQAGFEISWGGEGRVRVLAPTVGEIGGRGIERFQFADGTSMSMDEMMLRANWAPVLNTPLADQSTAEGAAFEISLPANAFQDADAGEALSYSATLANGQALPAWLAFNTETGKFSGTVPGNASGTLEVRVTATDPHGAKVSDVFTVTIADVNHAPEIRLPLSGQQVTQNDALTFSVPDDAFADPDDGDGLTYSATLANGDALPEWLRFDAATRTFTGTPGSGDVRDLDVTVTATDMAGQGVSQSFAIAVANVNDAPIVAMPLVAQTANENGTFSFTVPEDAFADPDAGDMMSFTATLDNGDALPAWLTFDAATRTFSGTPATVDIGSLSVKLTATDSAGLSATQGFILNVADVNDAPISGDALPAQQINEDSAFTYTLPASAFSDMDQGDALSFTAKLADGDALPSWLSFDAQTQTFSGTPANGDVGEINIKVTVTDASGLSASQAFKLNVANVNDAPQVVGVIVAPDVAENQPFTFAVPAGTFADVDAGDTLSYSAKLANGESLPAWLSLTQGADGRPQLAGTPPTSSPASLGIVLTAIDAAGASVSSSFSLNIAHSTQDPDQVLTGTKKSDTLTGGSGNDTLSGGSGNDILNGMGGRDTLNGDNGADTLNGGDDDDQLFGNAGSDALNGDAGNDVLHGGTGGDSLDGGADDDVLFGDEGLDQLFGGSGDDYLNGGTGADALDGGQGNDLLEGAQGMDVITDLQGNNLLSGNQGSDRLTGGDGNNVFIGGLTNDSIVSGAGNDLFAFNALDGDDHIRLGGGEDTLSLGGGIRYEDLSLMKQGDSLRLNLGNGDTITFDDWYTSAANQSLVNLQVIADSLGDYAPDGANTLKDNRMENFDFQALVAKFEEARAANPRLNRWSMMNSMLGAHLGGSDIAAMGGDIAYQYGHAGSLANVSVDAAQAILAAAQLNIDPQALQSVAALQTGGQRLM